MKRTPILPRNPAWPSRGPTTFAATVSITASFQKGPADAGPSLRRAGLLRPNRSVGLVDDDLSVRHLRRILEDPLELLVAHPLGCDTSRLVGLGRGVEQADRAHDAVAGVDQEVAAEAWQLAQAWRQTLADFLRQLVLVTRVDVFVASHGRKHVLLLTVSVQGWRTRVEFSCLAPRPGFASRRGKFGASAASALGLHAPAP